MCAPWFPFWVKKWLGDVKVLSMNWGAKGMHLHFMLCAWQEVPPCSLPDDDRYLRGLVGNPRNWRKLKESIFSAWELRSDGRWYQKALLEEWEKLSRKSEVRRAAANARWSRRDDNANADANGVQAPSLSMSMSMSDISPSGAARTREEPAPEVVQEIAEAAFDVIGTLVPATAKEWARMFPVEWVREALRIAEQRGKRSVQYVQAILGRWCAQGGPDGRSQSAPEPKPGRPSKYGGIGREVRQDNDDDDQVGEGVAVGE